MENFHLFEFLPLWVTFVGIVSIVMFSNALGVHLSHRRKKRFTLDTEEPVGTSVSATLGLLGFIMAFTFGLTASRYDSRKQLLLDEVTAIETTFMRADLIPEPHRSEVRNLIVKYVDLRIDLVQHPERVKQSIEQSEELHRQLWPHAAAMADADLKNADIVSLFVDSLNEMINLQTRRVTVGYYRIPLAVWIVLFGVTILAMFGVGYLFGRAQSVNWLLIIALSLAFSGVMALIVDLDRGGSGAVGAIKVSRQPMIDLDERLHRALAK